MEKTNIEILTEYAKSTNRKIVSTKEKYPISGIRTFTKFKEVIYIPNNEENTSYFIWFSDPYAKIGLPTIYCGAFISITESVKSSINIRNRNVIDKLNIFSNTKQNIIGDSKFDSKVVITGEMEPSVKEFLYDLKLQEELLQALKIEPFINISINEYSIDFIPEFKGKSYLSIINPQSWTTDADNIEKIFNQIEKIRNVIS